MLDLDEGSTSSKNDKSNSNIGKLNGGCAFLFCFLFMR
jgi:hypothetical protein